MQPLRYFSRIAGPYGGGRALLRSLFIPRTCNERIQRSKLLNRDPRLPQRQDKILVKKFVREKLGNEWVIPSLWEGTTLPPISQRTWPAPFVIKANNGCGWNVFVRDTRGLDWSAIERISHEWRGSTYGAEYGEWLYSAITPGLLVEPFISPTQELPVDYKLWTFKGAVQFIQVDTDREHHHKRTMFDLNWNQLPFTRGFPADTRAIPRPKSLDRMMEAAVILAENLQFARIDFYEISGNPLFGEITFYPGSGSQRFEPAEWDRKIGEMWR